MVEQSRRGLTAVIRAKLADGRLPIDRPSQTWAGLGSDHACDGCDEPITKAEIEYEAKFVVPAGVFRFHRKCFDVWLQERVARIA
jgi:hypothetical protein